MQLKDIVLEVRNRVQEGKQWLFSTNDIVKYANWAATSMVSEAQFLRTTYPFSTIAPFINAQGQSQGTQEYPMPADCDQLLQVKVQMGVLMPVVWSSQENLQIGAYIQALPLAAYVRRGIILTGLIPETETIGTGEAMVPPPDTSGQARWIIGFNPIPAAVYQCYADYIAFHPYIKNPQDTFLIPPRAEFYDALCDYAAAKCMRKAGDDARHDAFMLSFAAGQAKLKEWVALNNYIINPPSYGGEKANPLYTRGPTVLVVPPTNPQVSYG